LFTQSSKTGFGNVGGAQPSIVKQNPYREHSADHRKRTVSFAATRCAARLKPILADDLHASRIAHRTMWTAASTRLKRGFLRFLWLPPTEFPAAVAPGCVVAAQKRSPRTFFRPENPSQRSLPTGRVVPLINRFE
jgi:hypothetical protein